MLSIDIETKDPELLTKGPGEFREDTYIVGVSISDGITSEYYSLRHYNTSADEREKNLKILRDRLCVPGEMKIGANILYDLTFLIHKEGIPVTGPYYDVLIAEPLIYEHSFSYNLDSCAKKYLGIEKEKDEIKEWCEANGKKLTSKQRPASYIWEMPSWVVEGYAKADALLPFKIREKQIKILEEEGLLPVFELEMGLFPLYLKMRKNGVRIDKEKASEGIALCQDKVEEGWKTIRKLYGEINLNSYAQVAKLFNKFGLETGRTAKGAETANKNHFLKYKDVPVVGAILDVKEYGKTQKDFLDAGILGMELGGRIRSSYHPLRSDSGGTVSGRYSCSAPNQQQIPSRHEVLGPLCRSVFIPEEGEKWLSCDFSGQELRIFAHYATGRGADALRRKYQDDPLMDFHQEISDLTGLKRTASKTISLGSLYGMGWRTLGEKNGWDEEYSRAIYEEYHSRVPMVKDSLYSAQNVMERRGYIKTVLGRRARLKNRDKAFVALNRVIQGSAADQCKKSMLDAYNAGIFDVLTMLSTIHDEINVSMPLNKEGIEAGIELKNIMENAVRLEVPMISSLELGDNWGSLKKYSNIEEFRNVL